MDSQIWRLILLNDEIWGKHHGKNINWSGVKDNDYFIKRLLCPTKIISQVSWQALVLFGIPTKYL